MASAGLLALATAIGFSAYAAIALPGALAFYGLLSIDPPLDTLAAPHVWAPLLFLLALEELATRRRITDLLWNALHTLVRPLAAALLVASMLPDAGHAAQWIAATAAACLALAAHMSLLGIRTLDRTAGPPLHPALRTGAQTTLAGTIGIAAIREPAYGVAAASVALLLPLPWLPILWGAARTSVAALAALILRPWRPGRWRLGAEALPQRLRGKVPPHSPSGLRSAPATLARVGDRYRYRRGHLAFTPDAALFLYRRGLQPAALRLGAGPGSGDDAPLIQTLEIQATPGYALCVGPATPPAAAILAELAEGARDAGGGTELEGRGAV